MQSAPGRSPGERGIVREGGFVTLETPFEKAGENAGTVGRPETVETVATLDRIEGELAVLIPEGGGRLLVPAALLPETARDGTVLRITVSCDREETRARLERVEALRRRLLEENGGEGGASGDER